MALQGCGRGNPTALVRSIPVLMHLFDERKSEYDQIEVARENALHQAQRIIEVDMIKYTTFYAEYLETGQHVLDRDAFGEYCKTLQNQAKRTQATWFSNDSQPGEVFNPVMLWSPRAPDHGYIAAIFREYEKHGFGEFGFERDLGNRPVLGPTDQILSQIAASAGVHFDEGPRKKPRRISEKADSYDGDYRRITDVHRRSLICTGT